LLGGLGSCNANDDYFKHWVKKGTARGEKERKRMKREREENDTLGPFFPALH
jgi:hypothetical protein